jgi:serine/threonine-protein kinase
MLACPSCGSTYTRPQDFCGIDGHALVETQRLPLLGRTIDRYRIVEAVGSGGMAVVYRALHLNLEQSFAFKALHGHMAADETLAKRFHREAKVVSRLSHPHIVNVTDFGSTEHGLPYMVMEFLDGESLWSRAKQQAPVAPPRVARWMAQVASGLDHAHRKGFVHRDLKPQNIMLVRDEDEEVTKILDFGLVGILQPDAHSHTQLTSEGMFFGTPAYMSPEQITGGEVTGAADLYSLGVIMYLLLTGDAPFTGTVAELTRQHVSSPPPRPPLEYGGLRSIALRLLAKEPERRFARGREVVEAIERTGLLERDVSPDITLPDPVAPVVDPELSPEPELVLSEAVDARPVRRRAPRRSAAPWLWLGAATVVAGGAWAITQGPSLPSWPSGLVSSAGRRDAGSPRSDPTREAGSSEEPVPLPDPAPETEASPTAAADPDPVVSPSPAAPKTRTPTERAAAPEADPSGFPSSDRRLTTALARLGIPWTRLADAEPADTDQWTSCYRNPARPACRSHEALADRLIAAAERLSRSEPPVPDRAPSVPEPAPSPAPTTDARPPATPPDPPATPPDPPAAPPDSPAAPTEGEPGPAPAESEPPPDGDEAPREDAPDPLDPELERQLERSLEKLEAQTSTP